MNLKSLTMLLLTAAGLAAALPAAAANCPALLDHSFQRLQDSAPQSLCQYQGKVLLVVNTAANLSYIYIRGEYMWVYKTLERAIAEAKAAGWLGKNILGTGYDLEVHVQIGGGAYICGEETALIESLEGKRGNPRLIPPFPAVKGLWQNPTVVNNVQSISAVPWIINNSGADYAAIGKERSTGTKLISASGNIKKPGVYEIELGLSVYEFMNSDEYCGGMETDRPLKALVPGRSSVPIFPLILSIKQPMVMID